MASPASDINALIIAAKSSNLPTAADPRQIAMTDFVLAQGLLSKLPAHKLISNNIAGRHCRWSSSHKTANWICSTWQNPKLVNLFPHNPELNFYPQRESPSAGHNHSYAVHKLAREQRCVNILFPASASTGQRLWLKFQQSFCTYRRFLLIWYSITYPRPFSVVQ